MSTFSSLFFYPSLRRIDFLGYVKFSPPLISVVYPEESLVRLFLFFIVGAKYPQCPVFFFLSLMSTSLGPFFSLPLLNVAFSCLISSYLSRSEISRAGTFPPPISTYETRRKAGSDIDIKSLLPRILGSTVSSTIAVLLPFRLSDVTLHFR